MLTSMMPFLLLFAASSWNTVANEDKDNLPLCNWAQEYTNFAEMIQSRDMQQKIMLLASAWEGKFASAGVGVNFVSGLTYDWVDIYLDNGLAQPKASNRKDSTLYSEALHLAILAQSLNGSLYAQAFLGASISDSNLTTTAIEQFAIGQLVRKMTVYDEFRTAIPGLCGLPCDDMKHSEDGMRFRCWDNSWLYLFPIGHFGWALIAAGQALMNQAGNNDTIAALADKYISYAEELANGLLLAGLFRETYELATTVTFRTDLTECSQEGFTRNPGILGEDGTESETTAFFALFISDWTDYGGPEARDAFMTKRRRFLTSGTLQTDNDHQITAQSGPYYAAWERIAYLYMPFFEVPIAERLFRNGERARLQFSAQNRYPGLFTSVQCSVEPNNYTFDNYRLGIQELASQTVRFYEIVTPVAAFPALLHQETRAYGLAWYLAMLQGAKMQGPLGSSMSFHKVDIIAPMLKWIGKVPPIIGFGGGVGGLTSQYLQRKNKSNEFRAVIEREYGRVFTELNGEQVAFALPKVTVDPTGPRFSTCSNESYEGEAKIPQAPLKEDHLSLILIIAGSVVTLLLIVFSSFLLYCYRLRSENAKQRGYITGHYWEGHDEWLILPEDLVISDQKLGSGAFASVFKAVLKKVPAIAIKGLRYGTESNALMNVAVKMPLEMASDARRLEFKEEILFMKGLGHHPHLLNLLGYVISDEDSLANLALVVELCEHGDLLHVLRSTKSNLTQSAADKKSPSADPIGLQLQPTDLLPIAWQICNAMVFLHARNVIHRDLAARNILLTGQIIAKIGDFGLCRIGQQMGYISRGGLLPFRWLAIESLRNMEFSTKTDVWSFGVLLFELYSLGESPYSAIQQVDIQQHLEKGHRLHRPELADDEMYTIMTSCWTAKPDERPRPDQLENFLAGLIERNGDQYGYLNATREL